MYFEGRELKFAARPVKRSELKLNEVYFAVSYLDNEGLIPRFEAVVFIGTNLRPEQDGEYFQDYTSYKAGISISSTTPDDGAEFFIFPEGKLGFIFEYDDALDLLMKCSLRRKQAFGK